MSAHRTSQGLDPIRKYHLGNIESTLIQAMIEIQRGLIIHHPDVALESEGRPTGEGFLVGFIDEAKLHKLLARGAELYAGWKHGRLEGYLLISSSAEFESIFKRPENGTSSFAREAIHLEGRRYIYQIAVRAETRGRGVGGALIHAVRSDLATPLVTDVVIGVRSGPGQPLERTMNGRPVVNQASLSFMHKHGFRDIGEVDDYSFPWTPVLVSRAMVWDPGG